MAQDDSAQDRPSAPKLSPVAARSVRAAAVGAALGAVCLLALRGPWTGAVGQSCDQQAGWGCLGLALLVMWSAPFIGGILSWPLLRFIGVRPAWQVAAVGALVSWLVFKLYELASGDFPWRSWALPLVLGMAYLMAAYLVAPGVTPTRRLALCAILLLAWPVAALVGSRQAAEAQASERTRELTAVGVPLLAPDLKGYRLDYLSTDPNAHRLVYHLLPTVRQSGPAGDLLDITVTVSAAPPPFGPPDFCVAPTCVQVGPDTWRATVGNLNQYAARRQGYWVVLGPSGSDIPESDIRELARTLAPRSTGYFSRS